MSKSRQIEISNSLNSARQVLLQGESWPLIPPCVHYAGSEKLIRKSFELQDSLALPFDVCLDLEDGAEAGQESKQLEMVLELISQRRAQSSKRLGVRVSSFASGLWIKQIERLLSEPQFALSFLCIPKTRAQAELQTMLEHIVSVAERGRQNPPKVHLLIETASILPELEAVAQLPLIEALEFGIMDFVSESETLIPTAAISSPLQFEHELLRAVKVKLLSACLRARKIPVHNVTVSLSEEDTRADALRARQEFGFLRMWSIHPRQIKPIVEAMQPDFSQLPRAVDILSQAAKVNFAPIKYEGKLMDRASYRSELALIRQAELWGQKV